MGDYADTLMLPNLGTMAIIRWVPGPAEVIGTGTAVLHCHILPVRISFFPAVSIPEFAKGPSCIACRCQLPHVIDCQQLNQASHMWLLLGPQHEDEGCMAETHIH